MQAISRNRLRRCFTCHSAQVQGGLGSSHLPQDQTGKGRTLHQPRRTPHQQGSEQHQAHSTGQTSAASSQQAAGCQNAASEALAASREGFVMCHAACLLIQTLPLKTRPAPEIAGAVTPRAVTPRESKQRRPAPPAHAVFNSSLGIKLPPVPWLGGRCR